VSFTAVLGVDVLEHGLGGQRSWVSNTSIKVLDALCVGAGTTDEGRTSVVDTDTVHNQRVRNVFCCHVDYITFWLILMPL
jgi:hypothetical protein